MEDLFFSPSLAFEKVAAEVALSDDPNAWPQEILQELYRQCPYVADFDPHVVMDRVDAERAYAFGHIEISNKTASPMGTSEDALSASGVQQVRIPVIVKDGDLQPFDVLVTMDSKMLPLTENRMRQALFRPQAFDITSRTPGDQSMVSQLYPPFRQNYGMGGGGGTVMPKEASADSGRILPCIVGTINKSDFHKFASALRDPNVQMTFEVNPASVAALETLSEWRGTPTEKTAGALAHVIKPSVAQLSKISDGYLVKSASHAVWAPIEQHIDRGEAYRRFGGKVVLAADMSGSVTLSEGPDAQAGEEGAGPTLIKDFGVYQVQTPEGETLTGYVFPNLRDIDGTALPSCLFTDGEHMAYQGEILGVPGGEAMPLHEGSPKGRGVFFCVDNGEPHATIILEIAGSFAGPEGMPAMMASTMDGRRLAVSRQPHIQEIALSADTMLVPEHYRWLSLEGCQDVTLVGKPEDVGLKQAALRCGASVTVRADGPHNYSFTGLPIDKLASEEKTELDYDQALFLLGGLGTDLSYAQTKLAEAMYWSRPVEVRIGRHLTTAFEAHEQAKTAAQAYLGKIPNLRQHLVKEAAAIPDPMAVDTVLSLGFINPENIHSFIDGLPLIDEAQKRMCELLIASRLGLREIPTGALEKAIRATEQVVDALKSLAFSQN